MSRTRSITGVAGRAVRRRVARWLAVVVAAGGLAVSAYVAIPASAAASQWTQVSTGGWHTCGIKTNGTLWCWGFNADGQLGVGDKTNRTSPVRVGTSSSWAMVAAGAAHTCAIKNDGVRYCWGRNDSGQLGVGDNLPWSSPRRLTGESAWSSITAGAHHTCAIKTSGLGMCWGLNLYGAIGNNTTTNRNTPGTISGGRTWSTLTGGAHHTCGKDTGGARYCWGTNAGFELGLDGNTSARRLVPTTLPADGAYLEVSAGAYTSCGISTARRLYCWGRNDFGSAGVGDTVPHDELPLVSSASWSVVSPGGGHTCAVRTNGTAYCWGQNEAGQLGRGNTTDRLTPASLPSQSPPWSTISAGGAHSCGIRSDATLYCWGYNRQGQLGIGSTTTKTSPVQVP